MGISSKSQMKFLFTILEQNSEHPVFIVAQVKCNVTNGKSMNAIQVQFSF